MPLPKSLFWRDDTLHLLDQRALPHAERVITCKTVEQVREAIATLTVRGAPAIGIAAAYGMLLGLSDVSHQSLREELEKRAQYLMTARPTAVNLSWAVNRLLGVAERVEVPDLIAALEREAIAIHEEDKRACRGIADHGAHLILQDAGILTHCNAGALAVSEFGTALAPIYRANEQGRNPHVYIDETRPLLQGARLTAYELMRSNVHCTLITDNMAAHVMSKGKVDLVLVGADRVAANGDVANKIGTLNLAILCRHFSIPFYVACPRSTLDPDTATGDDIIIEQRDPAEVTHVAGSNSAPAGVPVENPAFDVTPAALVTGIITEIGIIRV